MKACPRPSATAQQWRAIRHALAEFDIPVYRAGPRSRSPRRSRDDRRHNDRASPTEAGRPPGAPATTPRRGWLTVLAAVVMGPSFGASLVEASWTPRERRPGVPAVRGRCRAGVRLHRRKGRLGSLADASRRRPVRGPGPAADHGRAHPGGAGRRSAGTLRPGHADGHRMGGRPDRLDGARGLRLRWTFQEGQYHLVFGALVWGAGLLAGYTIFGHRRPLDAVVVVGLALLGEHVAHQARPAGLLVVFSARRCCCSSGPTSSRRRSRGRGGRSVTRRLWRMYLIGGAAFVSRGAGRGPPHGDRLLEATPGPVAGPSEHVRRAGSDLQRIAPPGGEFRPTGGPTFGANVSRTASGSPAA